MAGLDPGHLRTVDLAFFANKRARSAGADGRVKPGHDEKGAAPGLCWRLWAFWPASANAMQQQRAGLHDLGAPVWGQESRRIELGDDRGTSDPGPNRQF